MFSNPIASYRSMDMDSDVLGADPHRLIVLLFDGAEAALVKAQGALASGNIPEKSKALLHAINIINGGLSASLNLEEGGELAANLQALYSYMVSRLIHANAYLDAAAVTEVQRLLGEISGAWREMGQNLKQQQQAQAPRP